VVIVGSSTLSYFYPTLVAGLGYSDHMAQYMVVPIYAVAFVAVAVTGYFSDKYPHQRGAIIAIWLSTSMVCSIAICAVYNYTARYVLLVFMAAGLWSTNGCSLSYAASTFGFMPQETRAVSLALVNALGNLAQIYGAYLFPDSDEPKYLLGFGVISGMCAFGVTVYAVAHILLRKYLPK
jgi:MFS family permease